MSTTLHIVCSSSLSCIVFITLSTIIHDLNDLELNGESRGDRPCRGRLAAATRAAGRLPAPRLQSRPPPRASWLRSSASPPEAPADPHRKHLHTRGAEVAVQM